MQGLVHNLEKTLHCYEGLSTRFTAQVLGNSKCTSVQMIYSIFTVYRRRSNYASFENICFVYATQH